MSERYPSDWDTRRRDVYKRDNYTCQNCGRNGGPKSNAELHAHHIVPISNGGTHQKSNLKTLCEDCHSAIHNDKMAPTANETRSDGTEDFPTAKAAFGGLILMVFGANIMSKVPVGGPIEIVAFLIMILGIFLLFASYQNYKKTH
jgi:hypothetical protein